MIRGTQVEWGTCFRTLQLPSIHHTLACWKDIIGVCLSSGKIIVLNTITGVCVLALSGHTRPVESLNFSLNGTLLVSGSDDKTVRLWDMQTGGLIKTFQQTDKVPSVSISLDCTLIASGSMTGTICLWNTGTGECCCVIDGHNNVVNSISFSPTNPKLLISASADHTIQWWDINGLQIGPTYQGDYVTFSSDGTLFASWMAGGSIATVQKSDSGVVVAELQGPSSREVKGSSSGWLQHSRGFRCCDFSPDGKFMAGSIGPNIYIWNITSSAPHIVDTFNGCAEQVISLTFSSCITSFSTRSCVKFWQIGTSSVNPVTNDSEPPSPTSAQIKAVSLQTNDSIALSSDSAGVVRSWDILTGLCRESFHTPAKDLGLGDMQLKDGRLVLVWIHQRQIHIWDSGKGGPPQVAAVPGKRLVKPRISGDGSIFFLLNEKFIQAWSVSTGKVVGEARLGKSTFFKFYAVDGSRVWAHSRNLETLVWDFGVSGLTPIPLSNITTVGPHPELCFKGWDNKPYRIKDRITGNEVFQFSGIYANPFDIQWDGQYLIAGYESGMVLILDFDCILPQQRYGVSIQTCRYYGMH